MSADPFTDPGAEFQAWSNDMFKADARERLAEERLAAARADLDKVEDAIKSGDLPVTGEPEAPVCSNEDHPRPVRAFARTTWPDGRFYPGLTCKGCLRTTLALYVNGEFDGRRHPILIEPLQEASR